ncbi:unnamed protein product [Linum trigynum]|uniref:Uncharacterized protein n=1 Tax=Linum trigynum TaxID=586398 RepID=A0AAV2E4F6_9ROSI
MSGRQGQIESGHDPSMPTTSKKIIEEGQGLDSELVTMTPDESPTVMPKLAFDLRLRSQREAAPRLGTREAKGDGDPERKEVGEGKELRREREREYGCLYWGWDKRVGVG